jgi:two-component system LytT family response regulator
VKTAPALSAYLVEDEPLCRADFRQTLRAFPEIRLLGEADTLTSARRFLTHHRVDLLFLDISVGRENGLDLLPKIPGPPLVIALTAHPQHAARGFTLDLVDYILKPVEADRLRAALDKARHRRAGAAWQPGRVTFLAEIDGKKTVFDRTEILGAQAMGNYVCLHTLRGKAVQRATFRRIARQLPPPLYLPVSRGRIVAHAQIRQWNRDSAGHLLLHLASGETLPVSRNHTASVLHALQK